jgi:hypothetical protein
LPGGDWIDRGVENFSFLSHLRERSGTSPVQTETVGRVNAEAKGEGGFSGREYVIELRNGLETGVRFRAAGVMLGAGGDEIGADADLMAFDLGNAGWVIINGGCRGRSLPDPDWAGGS